MVKEAT